MSEPLASTVLDVTDVRAEAKDVLLLELRAPGGAFLAPFEPGAHLEVTLPNGLVRHYSLVNDWRERERYVIGVGRAPASRGGSAFLHSQVRCGTRLKVRGPINNFPLDSEAARHLFIAGGIGITPIMAMIRRCLAERRPWHLVYAARSRQRAAFAEELAQIAPFLVHFHFDDEAGGILDADAALARAGEGTRIYCCGPEPLMRAVEERAAGRPVRFEWFNAPATGEDEAGEAFTVELRHSGETLTVPAGRSILEVLEASGRVIPFSCREGLGGTCRTGVCSGEIDHRDYVLSDEERAAGNAMMLCVSRAIGKHLVLDL
jgi:vanillate O-demethylase ferredoxin subunit